MTNTDDPAEGRRGRSTPADRFDRNVQRRSAQVLKQRVLDQQRAEFDRALAWAADHDAIEHAAALIVSARRRYLLGNGKSLGYASLLATDLSAGLSGVHLVDGATVRPLDVLGDVRQGDLLVAICMERYRRDTVEVATAYVNHGGELLLITDAEDAPLTDLAATKVVLGSAHSSASYANSPTSVVLALHLLTTLTIASSKGAGRRLRERDALAAELGLYTPEVP